MALDINDLLSKLSGVKQSSGREHWMARCPVPSHHDHNPSLSITQAPDKILLHCFGGCSQDDVLEAMGLTRSDFSDKSEPNWHESAIEATNQSKAPLKSDLSGSSSTDSQFYQKLLTKLQNRSERQVYVYVDENGKLVYRKTRYIKDGHKSFFFEHFDYETNAWVKDLGDIEPLLYNLPAVIKAIKDGETVYLVEGEKDVETLELLGYVATTSGPVNSWKSEFAEYFKGADVIAIPDKDPPGREYVKQAVKDLRPVAKRVRVLELPDLADKQDTTDWFEKGRTKEEFDGLLNSLEEIICEADIEDLFKSSESKSKEQDSPYLDWKTLFRQERSDREFLVTGWLLKGSDTVIFSEPKAGKSLLVLEIAVVLATGSASLGMEAREPIIVLYIDWENSEDDIRERLESMGLDDKDDLSHLYYRCLTEVPSFDTKEADEWIREEIKKTQPQLVIIDTMARAVEGEENSADTYRKYYNHVGRFLKSQKITVLRLDHSGKDASKGQRGSSDKAGSADAVYRLDQKDQTITLALTHGRTNYLAKQVKYTKSDEPLRHVPNDQSPTQQGTDLAHLLDEMNIPLDASIREINEALKKEKGKGKRLETIYEAQRIRRDRANREGKKAFKDREHPWEQGIGQQAEHPREQLGTSSQKTLSTSNNTMGTPTGTVGNTLGNNPATPIRGAVYPSEVDLDKNKSTDSDFLRKTEEPTLALEPMKQDNDPQPEFEPSSLENTQYSTCKQCDHELLAPKSQTSRLCKRCELANQDSSDGQDDSSTEVERGNNNDESTNIIEKIDTHKPDGSPIYDDSYFLDDEPEPRDLSDSELPQDRPDYGDTKLPQDRPDYGDTKLLKTYSDGSPFYEDNDID